MTGAPFWAAMWIVARELMLFAAIGFLILGIDELIVDLIWIVTRVKSFMRGGPRWSTADLPPPRADRHFAIFVPAWDEADVIGDMLSATLSHLPAHGVRLFVALYPNDEGTARVVKGINDERLFPVTLPHDGPTTKADALNALWRAMRAE
ncbi:MAG: glycosyltransferase, partial [Pseudomonadota bacterium]